MSRLSLQPALHTPLAAPTVDTSPQALGLESDTEFDPTSKEKNNVTSSPSRVKRAVEKTVDKLSRSVSGKGSLGQGSSPSASSGSRRIFSLRKGKARDQSGDDANTRSPSSSITVSTPSPSRSTSPSPTKSSSTVRVPAPRDDSPFITPPSPPLTSSRPPLSAFRGDGSMRAGTQTLIQALQAIRWTEDPDNDDDIINHSLPPLDSDSEEDEDKSDQPLASSIHTIYRPLARSRRADIPHPKSSAHPQSSSLQHAHTSPLLSEIESLDSSADEDQEVQPDFETTALSESIKGPLISSDLTAAAAGHVPLHLDPNTSAIISRTPRIRPARTGSMATVRIQRRVLLAEKLREVFDLPEIEEVWAEMPCWLLRSVLLQGYMYLTNSYLCFFAHMPSREDQVLKSGSLNKKAQRTKRWIKHWFVLKNDALSWYQSSSDPYFPHGIADLRYAISCEPVGEKDLRLRTNQKNILLSADSVPSRDEWVKAIRKVIFKAQNMGDSVKIAIPYSTIVDVDKSSAMDFSETIEVKVYDREEQYSVDSYFFAYFRDLPGTLNQIRDAVRAARERPLPLHAGTVMQTVLDTTVPRSSHSGIMSAERTQSMPGTALTLERPSSSSGFSAASSGFRLTSLLRPFQSSSTVTASSEVLAPTEEHEEFTHIARRPNSSFIPVTTPINTAEAQSVTQTDGLPLSAPSTAYMFVSPPPSAGGTAIVEHTEPVSSLWSVPSWLRPSRRVFGSSGTSQSGLESAVSMPAPATNIGQDANGVKEVYSTLASSGSKFTMGDMAFSVLQTPDTTVDPDVQDKFRAAFAYDEKETLLGYFPGYIYRLLPVYGRLYISTNFFCFKSSGPLAVRTRMTLPIRDILSTEKSKATRFGHHGLIIIVKGHEELFFEFGAEDKRNAFVDLLDAQIEDCRRRQALAAEESAPTTPGHRDALILEEFEAHTSPGSGDGDSDAEPGPEENMTDSLPAVMFTSASSTFLTFKPKESLHFTFLTIGSRGDVQPYIALGKGLMADGHRVRIATHGEFKEWIESYGMEFGYVGGDPAELMRICVENGMFTLSFMKESLQKFRGWLDDLLKTSWEAAQGTDVLIESPSAMGGYHIAEALGIPYFRAFTMTWTRTRAYPHAFAVPERKMGGSYNYMSYVMFDQVFWRAISGQINRWRRNLLHLGSTSLDKMEPHKIPFLYNFSPQVVPPPLDWPEWIRITGYWFLNDANVGSKLWTPPPDLVDFIDNAHQQGKKVVYIGFGSIVVSDPKSMTRCVIDAVLQSGVHAVLSKGWSDRLHVKTGDASEAEEPLPKEIYSISSIPHDWLFQRIDAACHHGGAGTTGASLRAGIPTIIKPFFGDQFFWADRVEALGVGSGVRKLTVDSLTEALISATSDVKQISRAKLIGEQIRSEDGVATAIESIYRDLEYARSLIKRQAAEDLLEEPSDTEDTTIKDQHSSRSTDHSENSSNGSAQGGAPSEDWSVISNSEDRRASFSSRNSESNRHKRNSLAAAVLSVLPDSLSPGSPRRRTLSASSPQS